MTIGRGRRPYQYLRPGTTTHPTTIEPENAAHQQTQPWTDAHTPTPAPAAATLEHARGPGGASSSNSSSTPSTDSHSSNCCSNLNNHEPPADVLNNPRLEFTRTWVKKLIDHTPTERMKQLGGVLCDPNHGDENIIMKLKLDYVIDSNYPLLALILAYFSMTDQPGSYLTQILDNTQELSPTFKACRAISMDPSRSGFCESLINNIKRYGYDCTHPFFDVYNLLRSVAVGMIPESSLTDTKGNILSLILPAVLEAGLVDLYAEFLTQTDKDHIHYCETLIRILLEQPTLTQEMKAKLVNHVCRPNPRFQSRSILSAVIIHDSFYGPITSLLLTVGASVNHQTLTRALELGNIELFLEMILSQPYLMAIDLNTAPIRERSLVDRVQRSDGRSKYSKPMGLAKSIVEKLDLWQQKQRTQLAANFNFQPNDAPIRDWLRQQLSSLPTELFSSTMHFNMSLDRDGKHRHDFIRRWIDQLRTAPKTIRLFEQSSKNLEATFLNDSLRLFLELEFRSHIPLVLTLFDDAHLPLIDVPLLFGSTNGVRMPVWSVMRELFELTRTNDYPSDELVAKQEILLEIFHATIKRLNQLNEFVQARTYRRGNEFALSQLHSRYSEQVDDEPSDDYGPTQQQEELFTSFEKSVTWVNEQIPNLLSQMINIIASHGTIEIFQKCWLKILPTIQFFHANEFDFWCIAVESVVLSLALKTDSQLLKRVIVFLSDPIVLTSDLFIPFKTETGFETIRGIVKGIEVGENASHQQILLSWLDDWESRFWRIMRTDLEAHLIPDLSNLVIRFFQPPQTSEEINGEPTGVDVAHTTVSFSSPSSFTFQFGSSTSSSFRPLSESTLASQPFAFATAPTPEFSFSFAALNNNKPKMTTNSTTTASVSITTESVNSTLMGPPTTTQPFAFAALQTNANIKSPISTIGGSSTSTTTTIASSTQVTPAASSPFNFSFLSQIQTANPPTTLASTNNSTPTPTSFVHPTAAVATAPFSFSFVGLTKPTMTTNSTQTALSQTPTTSTPTRPTMATFTNSVSPFTATTTRVTQPPFTFTSLQKTGQQ